MNVIGSQTGETGSFQPFCPSPGPYQDIAPFYFDLVRRLGFHRGSVFDLAGSHVELGTVPRACDDCIFQEALSKRPAYVRAKVAQRVELSRHVSDADL